MAKKQPPIIIKGLGAAGAAATVLIKAHPVLTLGRRPVGAGPRAVRRLGAAAATLVILAAPRPSSAQSGTYY